MKFGRNKRQAFQSPSAEDLPAICHAPYCAVAVLGQDQRAVLGHGDADRPAPDLVVRHDEAGGEILIFAGRLAVLEFQPHHLVAGADIAVPRTVQRDEGVALIISRKIAAFVEGDVERRRMRLHQHIRNGDLAGEVGASALVARVLVVADIVPGPAVESAFLHRGRVFEGGVVAKLVALVDDAPERAGRRLHGHAGAVAQAGGDRPAVLAVGVEGEHVGAALFRAPGLAQRLRFSPFLDTALRPGAHILGDVGAGADRQIERLAVGREGDVARPVVAGGDLGHDGFRLGGRFQVAVAIGEAHDAIAVGDIDPLRLVARRVEGDAVRPGQALGEDRFLRRLRAAFRQAIDADLVRPAVGDEEVAIRRHAHDAGIFDAGSDQLGGEAGRKLWLRTLGAVGDAAAIGGGLRRIGFRLILRLQQPAHARAVGLPVAEGLFTAEQRLIGLLCKGAGGQNQREARKAGDPHHAVLRRLLTRLIRSGARDRTYWASARKEKLARADLSERRSGLLGIQVVVEALFQLDEVGRQGQAHGAQLPQFLAQLLLDLVLVPGLVDHFLKQEVDLGLDCFQRHFFLPLQLPRP
ncbi:hypothetical protein MPL3356_70065 [Mesorhizobium plurifarium]|uniref:Uncharacterized protein n=1 Tax=Mesorhizobium plurifarium TaxID=69974 RepID=A0A090EGX4_MESPL|nr:hypothetical protein MPL3356_70065 [Mesorhizobium plurifarium]